MKSSFLKILFLSFVLIPLSLSPLQAEAQEEQDEEDAEFDIEAIIEEAEAQDPDLSDETLTEDDIEQDIDFLESPKESEPVYRPSARSKMKKKGRGTYIYHPNQKKGLFRIDRDGTYYYKVDSSKRVGSLSIKGGIANFQDLQDPNTGLRYSDIYDGDTAPSVQFEWEWKPFKKFRTLSLKVVSGLTFDRGKGRLFDEVAGDTSVLAQESYNFLYFPNSMGLTYRFRKYYKQLFVPFITGGVDYHVALEVRDDFNRTRFLGIPAAHFGGGLDINLGWLERMADLELDREFGINNTFFTLELRQIVAFNEDRDIGNTMFIAGFHFEY